jgi:hypothetical protein
VIQKHEALDQSMRPSSLHAARESIAAGLKPVWSSRS